MLTHSTLRPRATSRTSTKRLGRGSSSGKGGFCGRGCKGQKARTGKKDSSSLRRWTDSSPHASPKTPWWCILCKKSFFSSPTRDVQALADAGTKISL
jgi:ribosomal protein L15